MYQYLESRVNPSLGFRKGFAFCLLIYLPDFKRINHSLNLSKFTYLKYTKNYIVRTCQGRSENLGGWESKNVVYIICPPNWDRVNGSAKVWPLPPGSDGPACKFKFLHHLNQGNCGWLLIMDLWAMVSHVGIAMFPVISISSSTQCVGFNFDKFHHN